MLGGHNVNIFEQGNTASWRKAGGSMLGPARLSLAQASGNAERIAAAGRGLDVVRSKLSGAGTS